VGWDDNYDKTRFARDGIAAPPGNGAFIVKNSWGPEWAMADIFIFRITTTV